MCACMYIYICMCVYMYVCISVYPPLCLWHEVEYPKAHAAALPVKDSY